MRKKRKRKKIPLYKKKSFWFFLFFILLAFITSYFLLFSPYFQTKETQVLGVQTISKEELLKNFKSNATISLNILGNNLTSESLFIPSQGKLSNLLETFPEIEDISVKKNYFTKKITVNIKEKTPICIWCSNDVCVLLDKKATFIKNHENEIGFIKINEYIDYENNLKSWSGETKQDFILTLFTIYKNNNEIKEFDIYADKFLGKYKNITFVFDPKENIDWQVQKMNVILKTLDSHVENLKYIDLRFGEQVIIK
ncbi:MAG: hypothetical protein WC157_00675 [Candidatus Paceibacterota bacterium]